MIFFCGKCGRSIAAPVGPVRRVCTAGGKCDFGAFEAEQPKLGDYTERLLASIGITEDRYREAKELFGLPPTCGCSQRKQWLNDVSDWWRHS